jgi:hypothetical protein
MSKESDERFTPQPVLDVVREFAPIALDPCTTSANPTRAAQFLTAREDGLATPWRDMFAVDGEGLVFWNCPYSRGQVSAWALKAIREWSQDDVESIGLVIADMSTAASQLLLERANAVAFWRKRICFAGDQGAKFANAFFYFGDRQGRFKRVFEPHAAVLVLR